MLKTDAEVLDRENWKIDPIGYRYPETFCLRPVVVVKPQKNDRVFCLYSSRTHWMGKLNPEDCCKRLNKLLEYPDACTGPQDVFPFVINSTFDNADSVSLRNRVRNVWMGEGSLSTGHLKDFYDMVLKDTSSNKVKLPYITSSGGIPLSWFTQSVLEPNTWVSAVLFMNKTGHENIVARAIFRTDIVFDVKTDPAFARMSINDGVGTRLGGKNPQTFSMIPWTGTHKNRSKCFVNLLAFAVLRRKHTAIGYGAVHGIASAKRGEVCH